MNRLTTSRLPIPLPVRLASNLFVPYFPVVERGFKLCEDSGSNLVLGAPGENRNLRITRIEACNVHASTALSVSLGESGSSDSTRYLSAAGGFTAWDPGNGALVLPSNTALYVTLSAAGSVSVTAYYEVV